MLCYQNQIQLNSSFKYQNLNSHHNQIFTCDICSTFSPAHFRLMFVISCLSLLLHFYFFCLSQSAYDQTLSSPKQNISFHFSINFSCYSIFFFLSPSVSHIICYLFSMWFLYLEINTSFFTKKKQVRSGTGIWRSILHHLFGFMINLDIFSYKCVTDTGAHENFAWYIYFCPG